MSDRDPPRHVASDRLFSHGQEAHHTLPAELSNPTRPEDTSLGKSAHSSPYKSPLSALRTGEKWTSHTLADVLGLSPGIRGPSLLLSPLCSRAAAMSPGKQHSSYLEPYITAASRILSFPYPLVVVHESTHGLVLQEIDMKRTCRPRQRVR